MANTPTPYGLARVYKVGGKDKQFTYKFPLKCSAAGVGYGTNIAAGDPMAFSQTTVPGQGQVVLLTPFSAPTGGSATQPWKLFTSQVPIGVFVGVKYTDLQGNLINSELWVANTQVKAGTVPIVTVDCDPQSVYQIQLSGPITAAQTNSVFSADGMNANLVMNPVNVNIKSSACALNVANINSVPGATDFDNYWNFKIIGLANMPSTDPTNSWQDQYPNVIGVFNNHFLKAGTFGAYGS